jgi:Holliday junction DNA helicase RuvA
MIRSIQGVIQSKREEILIVSVLGIGFEIWVPRKISDQAETGKEIFLHIYFHVRENIMALYGFENLEQRGLFLMLLDVNGVGPKAAMAVLSTLSIDAVRNAVLSEEPAVFNRVPGIGKKTAEKILLQLKDKFKPGPGEVSGVGFLDIDSEVLEALTGLGYSVVEAQSAIQKIPSDAPGSVEERIILALKYFS